MYFIAVTLDVSKLSGWLNADVLCQESKGGYDAWNVVQAAGGAGGGGRRRYTQHAGEGSTGAGHGEERT